MKAGTTDEGRSHFAHSPSPHHLPVCTLGDRQTVSHIAIKASRSCHRAKDLQRRQPRWLSFAQRTRSPFVLGTRLVQEFPLALPHRRRRSARYHRRTPNRLNRDYLHCVGWRSSTTSSADIPGGAGIVGASARFCDKRRVAARKLKCARASCRNLGTRAWGPSSTQSWCGDETQDVNLIPQLIRQARPVFPKCVSVCVKSAPCRAEEVVGHSVVSMRSAGFVFSKQSGLLPWLGKAAKREQQPLKTMEFRQTLSKRSLGSGDALIQELVVHVSASP